MKQKKNGFTLIELLVTIVIMLSILTIAIINFIKISDKKKEEAWQQVKSEIETAATQYFKENEYFLDNLSDENGAYVSVGTLVDKDYINVVTNPKTGKKIDSCSIVLVQKSENKQLYYYIDKSDDEYKNINISKGNCVMLEPNIIALNKISNESSENTEISNCDDISLSGPKSKTNDNWYTGDVTVSYAGEYLDTIDSSVKNKEYDINDKKCQVTVNIDKVEPTITFSAYKYEGDKISKDSVQKKEYLSNDSYSFGNWTNKYILALVEIKIGPSSQVKCTNTDPNSIRPTDNFINYANDNKKKYYYTNVRYLGKSQLKCTVTSKAYAKKEETREIKLDRTKPTVTLNKYKRKNEDKLNDKSSVSGLSAYTSNTWYSGYVFTKISYTDPKGKYNDKNVTDSDSGINTNTIKSWATGETTNVTSKKITRNVDAQGKSEVFYEVCDNAGNCTEVSTGNILLDRKKPTISVNLYKNNTGSSVSTSTGLSSYPENTWYSGRVFTKAITSDTNGNINVSGIKETIYTTSGDTQEDKDKVGNYRNIGANGISKIKYKTCDKAGNCSDYTRDYTIKIDKKVPSAPSISLKSGTCSTSNSPWACTTPTTLKSTYTCENVSGCKVKRKTNNGDWGSGYSLKNKEKHDENYTKIDYGEDITKYAKVESGAGLESSVTSKRVKVSDVCTAMEENPTQFISISASVNNTDDLKTKASDTDSYNTDVKFTYTINNSKVKFLVATGAFCQYGNSNKSPTCHHVTSSSPRYATETNYITSTTSGNNVIYTKNNHCTPSGNCKSGWTWVGTCVVLECDSKHAKVCYRHKIGTREYDSTHKYTGNVVGY